jgi:hypothetical protein
MEKRAMQSYLQPLTRVLLTCSLLILLTTAKKASSFESVEHESVSNQALALVVAVLDSQSEAALSDDRAHSRRARSLDILRQLLPKMTRDETTVTAPIPQVLTYGHFVMLADFIRDPAVLFRTWGEVDNLPRTQAELDLDYIEEVRRDYFALALASHQNRDHFQNSLLRTQWWWHRSGAVVNRWVKRN